MSSELDSRSGKSSVGPSSAGPSSAGPRSASPRSAGPRSSAPAPRRLHLLRADAFPLVLVGILSLGGLAILWATTAAAPVHFVNALAASLTVEVDGAKVEVPSGGHVEKQFDVGVHHVRVRAGDQAIEESVIYVPRFHDALVYDPLGLQIIAKRRIRYSTAPSNNVGDDDDAEIYAGRRWVVVEDADYVFREPPRQISTKQKTGSIEKTWVDAPAEARWQDTFGYLLGGGNLGQAADIVQTWSAAPPGYMPPEALQYALVLPEMAFGPDAAMGALRQARDLDPQNRNAHHTYQEAMLQLGRREALLAEYRERVAKAPDSPIEAAARLRVEAMADSDHLLDLALARFPDDAWLRLLDASRRLDRGDLDGALKTFDSVPAEKMDAVFVYGRVRAYAAAKRPALALELIDKRLRDAPQDPMLLLLRAQLESFTGATAPPKLPDDPAVAAYIRTILGGTAPATPTPSPFERASQLQAMIVDDPAAAGREVPSMAQGAMRPVHRGLAMLLTAELERLGEWKQAGRLRRAALDPRVERGDILAYLFDGTESRELERLDDDARAALDVVRARVLLEAGDDEGAKRLVASAKKIDVLEGPVSRALAAWPPPKTSDAGLVVFAWRPAPR